MPRIYASNNDPIDFCKGCFPKSDREVLPYQLEAMGEGPDGRGDCFGYDCDHPTYEYEDYDCDKCGRRLTGRDD